MLLSSVLSEAGWLATMKAISSVCEVLVSPEGQLLMREHRENRAEFAAWVVGLVSRVKVGPR
jgi:hypothetical protein